jgi:hypothetical protein
MRTDAGKFAGLGFGQPFWGIRDFHRSVKGRVLRNDAAVCRLIASRLARDWIHLSKSGGSWLFWLPSAQQCWSIPLSRAVGGCETWVTGAATDRRRYVLNFMA